MSSVFGKNSVPDPSVKRNTFDLSFSNSLTMHMGTLYPVFCKEVLPGDTFKIDAAFGLRFMPLAFPIQTKMRANMQFFYVRNRNLWKDWVKFITKTGNPSQFPFINASRVSQTSSLGDYLGLPTTVVANSVSANYSISNLYTLYPATNPYTSSEFGNLYIDLDKVKDDIYPSIYYTYPSKHGGDFTASAIEGGFDYAAKSFVSQYVFNYKQDSTVPSSFQVHPDNILRITFATDENNYQSLNSSLDKLRFILYDGLGPGAAPEQLKGLSQGVVTNVRNGTVNGDNACYFDVEFTCTDIVSIRKTARIVAVSLDGDLKSVLPYEFTTVYQSFISSLDELINYPSASVIPSFITRNVSVLSGSSNSNVDPANVPYSVSALPFRAYESVYNAFYRDDRNNPYILNGVSDPNVYLPTTDGGIDMNDYQLHQVNWEQDFLTTAVPTPQQGAAPLVGVTSTGKATFADSDGNTYSAQFNVGKDGDTVESVTFDDPSIPQDAKRTAIQLATEGISINDFRNVNALQRWLETNMRKGYKYKDQIASHFGVNISYAELDMPEFIGGISQRVEIQQINQTSQGSDTDPLGSYAAQASVVGGNNHTISNYCDEHGFIIGLLYVTPVPTYSQLLPKHFTKFDPMDYFFPEFGHIGYQPIPYREVCPIQATVSNVPLTDTFGYQRAWYDYLQSVDEVHGQFRTDLSSFILMRIFKSLPSLRPEFLTVSQDQLNEVFTVTALPDEDGNLTPVQPILGQVHFKCLAKRKIPRYGVPRLE